MLLVWSMENKAKLTPLVPELINVSNDAVPDEKLGLIYTARGLL